jgi:hypothetical protein
VTPTSAPDDLDALRQIARAAGFVWSDDELESLRPLISQARAAFQALQALPLHEVEPATQFRMF